MKFFQSARPPTGASPTGASPTGASPTGASPAGGSSAGESLVELLPIGPAALGRLVAVLLGVGLAISGCGQGSAQGSGSDALPDFSAGALVIEGVRVLPMDEERTLEDQAVVVQDGRIAWIGRAEDLDLPEGAVRVNGTGRTLLPGLAEMHAHVPGDEAPRDLLEDILFLYVANGITTIRGMLGAPGQLVVREELERGDLVGPHMIVGAPSLNGNTAPDPATAERLVRGYADQGYDFLKIHPGIPMDSWDRMVEVAGEVGITYAGHVPEDVGIQHALETDIATVDHLDGYLQGALSQELQSRLAGNLGVIPTAEMISGIDWDRVDELVDLTVREGAWNVPTLYLWENFYAPIDADSMIAQPEMSHVPRSMREGWASAKKRRGSETAAVAEAVAEARLRLLRKLHSAGAGILMGTDSPQMFNVPGFALHHELLIMGEVMSPFEVLASGTRNVAEYVDASLGGESDFGTVAVGQRADLILVEGNPLERLGDVARLAGVMVAGRWISGEEIQAGLDALAEKYGR